MRIFSLPSMVSLHMTWNFSSMATSCTAFARNKCQPNLRTDRGGLNESEEAEGITNLGVKVGGMSGRLPQLRQV
jgi:hypothetical protein